MSTEQQQNAGARKTIVMEGSVSVNGTAKEREQWGKEETTYIIVSMLKPVIYYFPYTFTQTLNNTIMVTCEIYFRSSGK